jgi:hypothetical protein
MRYLIVLALVVLTGCATIIRGTEQQISVNTNPIGAHLDFSNGQSCLSPCSLKVSRDTALQINISKDGCATQTATMIPTLSGGGVILGGLIDYGTGAVYDLQPNPLTLTLACQTGASQAALAPASFAPRPPAMMSQDAPAPVAKPDLGIRGSTVSRNDAGPVTRMADPHGAWIDTILPGSTAAKAGLRRADVIQTYNGHRVNTYEELNAYVNETIPGSSAKLGVWRAGQIVVVNVDF